jgi:hypothetical protein
MQMAELFVWWCLPVLVRGEQDALVSALKVQAITTGSSRRDKSRSMEYGAVH